MTYPTFNNSNPVVQGYRSNFLTSTHRPRFFPRYLRKPMDRQIRSRQFRPNSRQLQQKMTYWGPNIPASTKPSKPLNGWNTGMKIANQLVKLADYIYKIVHLVQQRGGEIFAGHGCSPGCVCGGIAATATVVVVAAGVGVGLGVGLTNEQAAVNLTGLLETSPVLFYSSTVAPGNGTGR